MKQEKEIKEGIVNRKEAKKYEHTLTCCSGR
jgi:hypothetical protein